MLKFSLPLINQIESKVQEYTYISFKNELSNSIY